MMFDDRYEVYLADTEEARRIHYQVRYKVYCIEEGFEDSQDYARYEESDEWDSNSVHFIVRSKNSGQWIAAMRMVLHGQNGLPIEHMCDIRSLEASNDTAEISRMCIIDEHRRVPHPKSAPKKDVFTVYPGNAKTGNQAPVNLRAHKSEIILGLLRAAVDYSYEHGINNWYFLTTRALARLINRLCIQLVCVGNPCHHRGERHPFIANLREAEKQATEGCPIIGEWRDQRTISYHRCSELGLSRSLPMNNQRLVA